MENKLPKEYKENIFQKIHNHIKKIFFNKKEKVSENITSENIIENNIETVENDDFIEYIQINETYKNTEYEKKKFMEKLEENPDLLDNFSTERLEKILQYYLDENEKKRKKIEKLTSRLM